MKSRKIVVTSLTASLLVLLFYLLAKILIPFIQSFLWASIIVILSWPLYEKVCCKVKSRSFTALLFTALMLIFILLPFAYFVTHLVNEATDLYPVVEKTLKDPNWQENFKRHKTLAFVIDQGKPILEKLNIEISQIVSTVSRKTAAIAGAIFKNSFIVLFRIFMTAIFIFMLYRDGPKILDGLRTFIPLPNWRCRQMEQDIYRMLQAIFFGVFFTAIVQGIMGGIGFAILGLPSPLFFGTLMAFFALFPVGGAALVWLPGAVILLATGSVTKGVILAIWGGILVSSLDNFLRPILISGRSKFPLILVFIGALGGIMAFGFMGIFVGPIVLAITGRILLVFEEILHPQHPDDEPEEETTEPVVSKETT
ncbi:MAG TPA: AI-2E family transporter [Thermoanaerobaculia bacterium]|nr:AI-2E family transporter [Thermoanaerobaculia bacterium]HUM30792.1 AI-2E family transporter [Thermoanaerobaculia bacterium]HXK69008.1 AI-2E family transporter [Thermoanaerobaculia bacterium]